MKIWIKTVVRSANKPTREASIQIQTILRELHPINGFVYGNCTLENDTLTFEIHPRKNSRAICSGCGCKRPGYDRLEKRTFSFIPCWGLMVMFVYQMRRVDCRSCGVKVEQVPWAGGKHRACDAFRLFLSRWAKRLSWSETAEAFQTSWDTVYRSVQWVVEFGLKHRSLDSIEAVGVDEVVYRKGHNYMTLVYQIDNGIKRLLFIGKDRCESTLRDIFRDLGQERCESIKVVCSDMWKPYLNVIRDQLPNALNILDRFHIVKKLNEAVDQVRREETKAMKQQGYDPILTNSRYCFLKRPPNLTPKQGDKLAELLRYDLRTVRAYCLKEAFEAFWQYKSSYWAKWFLRKWCTRVMRSRLEPMMKFVGTLRNHEMLIMNYFKTKERYSSGVVEGLNLKVNLTMRKAYGFKSFPVMETALYHQLGRLPEPEFTHRFC